MVPLQPGEFIPGRSYGPTVPPRWGRKKSTHRPEVFLVGENGVDPKDCVPWQCGLGMFEI